MVARSLDGLWFAGLSVLRATRLLRDRSACAHGFQLCNRAESNLVADTLWLRIGYVPSRLNVSVSMGSLRGQRFLHGGALSVTGHVRPARPCRTLRFYLAAAHRLGHGAICYES